MQKLKTMVLGVMLAGGLVAAPARADVNLGDLVGVVRGLTGGNSVQTYQGGNDLGAQLGGVLLQQLLSGGLTNVIGGSSGSEVVTGDLQMAPLPNSTVAFLRPTVQVNFPSRVRTDGVRLAVDGRDVTSEARVEQRLVRYVPAADLAPGVHHVYLEVLDRNNQLLSRDWTFTVGQ